MEWNGMEWNGMEWNGMEWNGMEWNGMEWNVKIGWKSDETGRAVTKNAPLRTVAVGVDIGGYVPARQGAVDGRVETV